MVSYEKNLKMLLREPLYISGGGVYHSPWDIEWKDKPFVVSDESVVPSQKISILVRNILENGTPAEESAVYIHVPFCRLSCTYCAFFKKKADPEEQHEYARFLCKEIDLLRGSPYIARSHVRAVFFGGGTPGILSADDITAVLERIRTVFPLAEDAEVTMESSLSDMTDEKMDAAVEGGVNRFSFGIQSFQTTIRNAVGRPLPREEVIKRLAHFTRKNAIIIIDLMYGLPGQTEETMRQDIRDAEACGVAGLDLYKLQLLPGSPLANSFAKEGKTLDVLSLQSLFRAAEDELTKTGALNISCTHWKWLDQEKSIYNTLASNGSDIIPIGIACGGKIASIRMMKPVSEEMYHRAVAMGEFVPLAVRHQSRYKEIFQIVEAAADLGIISPAEMESQCKIPFSSFLTPLLDIWASWGLMKKSGGLYVYTTAGRYWYRTLMRHMLHVTQYILSGKIDENKGNIRFKGMINMK